ncbi:MAG: YjbH domain-containing protein [Pseudomonadales bacterium]|nr:YjbH domain-containing protein [Pseudomonadales bacterium]
MLKTKKIALLFTLSPLATSIAQAQNDSMSLNGFTGIFNIPNAHVTEYGTGVASYSDMMFYRGEYRHNNNLVGSFGIFPHVELSGRIAWFNTHTNLYIEEEKEARDLSANLKINIPYIPDNWFDLAIGEQDVGGAASYFDAKYIVASRSFGPLRIDIGAGQNDVSERLDGVFGGIEFSPFEWISVIAEHDGQSVNSGFRLSSPQQWAPNGFRAELTVLADSDNETANGKSFFGLNFKFPLGGGFTNARPAPVERTKVAAHDIQATPNRKPIALAQNRLRRSLKPTKTESARTINASTPTPQNQNYTPLRNIANQIADAGFERIDVGVRNNTLIVAFENNIYNRSELDALGIVLGIVARSGKQYPRATVILRNQNLPVIALDTNPERYLAFLNENAPAPIYAYYPSSADYGSVNWIGPTVKKFNPKPRVTFFPILRAGIATEFGVWDYSFALGTNVTSHLWPGALISATHVDELTSSEDFEEGRAFANTKVPSGLRDMSVQQGFKLGRFAYNNISVGRFRYDYSGFFNQTLIHDASGQHQFSLRFGDFEHEETKENKDFQLLSYRYYMPEYDVALKGTYGNFWTEDDGLRIDSVFRFGDQSVELFYKNTTPPDADDNDEFIGIAWSLALSPRKDWDSDFLQIKGHEYWRWGLQTRIGEDRNSLSFGAADIAQFNWEIERTYLNNDKLSPEYIYRNLHRLEQAAE